MNRTQVPKNCEALKLAPLKDAFCCLPEFLRKKNFNRGSECKKELKVNDKS